MQPAGCANKPAACFADRPAGRSQRYGSLRNCVQRLQLCTVANIIFVYTKSVISDKLDTEPSCTHTS